MPADDVNFLKMGQEAVTSIEVSETLSSFMAQNGGSIGAVLVFVFFLAAILFVIFFVGKGLTNLFS